MKFILILLSIFFTLYKVGGSSISITYGDFLGFVVVIFFINDFLSKRIIINQFAKLWLYFIFFLFLSSLLNFTTFEGAFLNIFRTNLFSVIFYIYIYSLLLKDKLSPKILLIGIYCLALVFLLKTWPEMQKAWATADIEFTNVNIFDSSLNLNTWGYVLVLFFSIALYFYSVKIYKNISLGAAVIVGVFIFFSYSRTAYALSFFIVLYTIVYVNKIAVNKIAGSALLLLGIYIFKDYLNFFNFKVSDAAIEFFESKAGKSSDDLINTRFYLINIKPLQDALRDLNIFQIFVGDGKSIQHSWISHNLIVTGIIGFIFFIKRFIYAIKYSFKVRLKRDKIISSKFLILIILIILINDFITNVSSFLPFAAYLSAIIMAILFASLDSKTNLILKKDNAK